MYPRKHFPFSFALGIVVIALFFLIVVPMAHCQVDITPSRPDQSFLVLGRTLKWGVSGSGAGDCSFASSACGANNNFVFPVQYPQEVIAITIFNSSNQTKTFNLTVTATNDVAVTQLQSNLNPATGNFNRWANLVAPSCITSNQFTSCSPPTITANGWAFFYFQTAGASRVAIVISNSAVGNGSGGADLMVSQTPTQAAALTPNSIVSSGGIVPLNTVNSVAPNNNSAIPFVYLPGAQGSVSTLGVLGVGNYVSDVASNEFDPLASDKDLTDSFSSGPGGGAGGAALMLMNGTNWSRGKAQSSGNESTSQTPGSALPGVALTTTPADWSVAVQAATASQCSSSQAAQAGFRHCATGIEACVSATAAQAQLFINLRDGASGAGTIRWNGIIAGAVGTFGCVVHEFAGGPICGTAGTAMTLELSAATAATNGCALTVKGYDSN